MDLSPYVSAVQSGLTNAAALADEPTQEVARRLGSALEPSTRLALTRALTDAATAISADLAPGSVQVRMIDGEPDLVVSLPGPAGTPTLLVPEPPLAAEPPAAPEPPTAPEPPGADTDDDDEPLARISLRLPTSVKERVDQYAGREGISTNAWLVRAVLDALRDREGGGAADASAAASATGSASSGWSPFPGNVFGAGGVFGPNGVFGPHGPFAGGGARWVPPAPGRDPGRDRERTGERFGDRVGGPGRDRGRLGPVQGWVR